MEPSGSLLIENAVKIYPFVKKRPRSVQRTSQWLSPRSISSPGAFSQSTLQLEQIINGSEMNTNSCLQQFEKQRVVSFPEHIYLHQHSRLEVSGSRSNSYTIDSASSENHNISSDTVEFTLNSEASPTRVFPNIHASQDKTKLQGDEDWLTWTSVPPRPIPALHGPASLPYARCPSGAEGTLIEEPSLLPHIIWGLEPDDMLGFQYSQGVRRKYNNRPKNQKKAAHPVSESIRAKEDDGSRNFSYTTPVICEDCPSEIVFNGSREDDPLTHGFRTIQSMIPNHPIMDEIACSRGGIGLGLEPCFAGPFGSKEQIPVKSVTYLPTPPNSSSPQWNATFSPPVSHPFLIPLPTCDEIESPTVAVNTHTTNLTNMLSDSFTSLKLASASDTYYTSSKNRASYQHHISSGFFRENLETVVEESTLSQTVTSSIYYPSDNISIVDDTKFQAQTVEDYFNSNERDPVEQPIVSLPGYTQARNHRNSNSIDAKFKVNGRTIHPNKLRLFPTSRPLHKKS